MPRKVKKNRNGSGSRPVERNGSFSMLVTLGRKPNGSLIRKRVTAPTEEACTLKAKELQVMYGRGLMGEPSSITFEEFANQWLQRESRGITKNTLSLYKQELRYAYAHIGKKRLSDLRPAHIRQLFDSLSHYQTERHNKPLSTRTIRKVRDKVYAVLQEALTLEIITRNPAEGVEPKTPPIEPIGIALEPEQQGALLFQASNRRSYVIIHLALSTGIRRGELLALKRDRDIDLEARVLHIRESRDSEVHKPKSKAAVRTIPLSPGAVRVLGDWYAKIEEDRANARGAYLDSGYLLVDELGQPVHSDTPNMVLDRTIISLHKEMATADFPSIRMHDLRHTCATNWLLGVHGPRIPVEVVSRWLGHASPAVTMQVYAHVLKKIADDHAPLVHDLPTPVKSNQPRVEA